MEDIGRPGKASQVSAHLVIIQMSDFSLQKEASSERLEFDMSGGAGGNPQPSGERSPPSTEACELLDSEYTLPIANIIRIMKKGPVPEHAKISKDAKGCIQSSVTEFIGFITGEASDRCIHEKRKTINGDDILWALERLGFDNYMEPLRIYLGKWRDSIAAPIPPHPSLMRQHLPGSSDQENEGVPLAGTQGSASCSVSPSSGPYNVVYNVAEQQYVYRNQSSVGCW